MGERVAAVGLDLGGTNLRSLHLSESGDILARRIEALPRQASRGDLIDLAVETTHALARDTGERPVGVGVGIGALLSPSGRPLPGLSNQPSLVGLDVAEHLGARLGLPCEIENDARAAIRGEAAFGAARGRNNAICITVGSGIGSGLLIGGRIHEGSHKRPDHTARARVHGVARFCSAIVFRSIAVADCFVASRSFSSVVHGRSWPSKLNSTLIPCGSKQKS